MSMRPFLVSLPLTGLLALGGPGVSAQYRATPTEHPPLPDHAAAFWLAPAGGGGSSEESPLAKAVAYLEDDEPRKAAPLLRETLAGPLAPYQQYYRAVLYERLERLDDAERLFRELAGDEPPATFVSAQARLRAGEIAELREDADAAVAMYEPLTKVKMVSPDDAWLRLGRARLAAGDRRGALEAFAQLYYEFPFSDLGATAAAQIADVDGWEPFEPGSSRYIHELGRAERLFAGRRYAQAREGFALVRPHARGDDAERVALRLAECDYHLKRYRAARTALEPLTRKARRRAEARFFDLSAARAMGRHTEYVRLARALVREFPTESWAEETLNSLGTHYILIDEDAEAEKAFVELLDRFPDGQHAPRAAWKAGWAAYRAGRHDEAAAIFERASVTFPRSNYRPAWLYWAARAADARGDTADAHRLFGVVIADYLNSYYGRLASRVLSAGGLEPMQLAAAVASVQPDAVPAVARVAGDEHAALSRTVRALLAAGLYEDAIGELQWALRTNGDSPVLQATLGVAYAGNGELRRAINAVKRAYPQYLSAGGDGLPSEVRQLIFPLAYWTLISKYASAHDLDPYLIAALMAQESTFDADIRSSANAIGLMQIVPATGRRYARKLGIRPFRTSKLTNAEINVRIGTAYFADLVERFGAVHLALASYNAGPTAASRWAAERPGVDRDEFIDDIPYPETQHYVKKVLGTAEDYRHLYGELGVPAVAGPPGSAARVSAAPEAQLAR